MKDQAQRLRELFGGDTGSRPRSLAVASGKGGVGKTNLSVNLSVFLSQQRKRVLLLDADLGLANVDVALGLMPHRTMAHVVAGEATLSQVIVKAMPGLWVLPGASGLAGLADLDLGTSERLVTELSALRGEFDWVVVDTAPGIGANGLTFAAAADEVLLVTAPEPTAVTDGYAFLKVLFDTQASKRPESPASVYVVVNMVSSEEQGHRWGVHLQRVAQRFQQRFVEYLGCIPFDAAVGESIRRQQPFILNSPVSPGSRAVKELGGRLLCRKATGPSSKSQEVVCRAAYAATVA